MAPIKGKLIIVCQKECVLQTLLVADNLVYVLGSVPDYRQLIIDILQSQVKVERG